MSFLHTHSTECIKSELDLFNIPPTQTSIENSYWTQYKPISSLTNDGPIEFVIPGNSDEYLDLPHTLLYIKASFRTDAALGPDNAALVAQVGPVNNFLHTLFSQVDVSLNRQPISPPNSNYAYRAYLETLLNYGPAAKHSHLQTVLWYDDTPGKMNDFTENNGLVKRRNLLNSDKSIDLIGHIHHEIFNQDKLLLNGVEVGVRFVQSRDGFAIMDPTNVHKVVISEAALYVRRVKCYANILIEHNKLLAMSTAKYPITRVQVKHIVLHSGIHGESIDNVFLGPLAKRIICGFVSNKAFNGDRKENPFNFDNFHINHFALSVDGIQVPSRHLQPNFDASLFVEAYHSLFSGTGIHFLNQGNCVSREAFKNGYCLFAYDLTPDLSANSGSHFNLVRHGSVRIDVRFNQELTDNVNCIVYAEYDSILEIDATRQCIVDFSG